MFIEIFKVSENKTFRQVWTFDIEAPPGWRKGIIKITKYEEQERTSVKRYKTIGTWIAGLGFGEGRRKRDVLRANMYWIEKREIHDLCNRDIYKALIKEFNILGWKGEKDNEVH